MIRVAPSPPPVGSRWLVLPGSPFAGQTFAGQALTVRPYFGDPDYLSVCADGDGAAGHGLHPLWFDPKWMRRLS